MHTLKKRLKENDTLFAIWAGLASFLAYFCMYMYRKPFSAAGFEEFEWMGLDYKTIIVIAQVIGYALSKFIGIKVISELQDKNRIPLFFTLIAFALLALLGFSLSPVKWGPAWLFLNGLPLGMIWGIVFSYCEGRRLTEVLTVFISANYILSSGFAKSFGTLLLSFGYSAFQMPLYIGLMTLPLLFLSIWMLSIIPPPTSQEQNDKLERKPMNREIRNNFYQSYGRLLICFVIFYIILTVIRDIRDNFALEIWSDLGVTAQASLYTVSEVPIAIVVLLALGSLYRIRKNFSAYQIGLSLSLGSILLLIITTFMIRHGIISPIIWMTISGIGLFVPYILMNGIIFDRFIASFKVSSNVGFLMYIADAFGYLASIGIIFLKNFVGLEINWLTYYIALCSWGGIAAGVVLLVLYQISRKKYSKNLQINETS